jgi:5'-3' exonuclease
VFPYYKADRKKAREDSGFNWPLIFDSINLIKEELRAVFPYKVIEIEGAEADDIIGALVMKYGDTSEKILVLSGDKDFVQLQRYNNVKQFDPVQKKFRTTNDPDRFIKEHIMRGDIGDGIPNFLSSDNCLVVGERQKPVATKKDLPLPTVRSIFKQAGL